MAYKLQKRCKVRGCGNLHHNANGYCDEHQVARRGRDERPSAQERGYDAKWKAFARKFLALHPVCEICGAPASCVDHKTATADMMMDAYGSFDYDEANYQALCSACNTRKGRREDVSMRRSYIEGKQFLTRGEGQKKSTDNEHRAGQLCHTHTREDRG